MLGQEETEKAQCWQVPQRHQTLKQIFLTQTLGRGGEAEL